MDSRTVVKCHLELLKNEQHCDVAFIVGEAKERILSHRFPLVAHSSVFAAMFAKRWKSASDDVQEIEIPDVQPSIFRQFLQYMYGDEFTTEIESAPEMCYVAHKYGVTELVNRCENQMVSEMRKTRKDNIITIYQVASLFDLSWLKFQAGDRIKLEFSALIDYPGFKSISENTLLELLPRDLWVDELKLFDALLRWSHVKLGTETPSPLDQRAVLKTLLPLIRFPSMSVQDFTLKVIPKGILTPEESTALLKYLESEEPARTRLRANLGFPWQARPPPMTEYLIKFYRRKENEQELTPNDFEEVEHQVDVQKFSLVQSLPLLSSGVNFTAFISSIILHGPNYSCITNETISWRLTNSWKVSLKLEKIGPIKNRRTDDDRAETETCCSEESERTIDNLEIFGNKKTVIDINPPFVIQYMYLYRISVSYFSSVYLPDSAKLYETKFQDYMTSTKKQNCIFGRNKEGIAERQITILANYSSVDKYDKDRFLKDDFTGPESYYACPQYNSDTDYSDDDYEIEPPMPSHCIRGINLKVRYY